MTLTKKFENIIFNYIRKQYEREHIVSLLRVDAEEFAIDFYNWMRKEDTPENAEKYFGYTDKDMLNVFKEENKL
jgi:hypothetical protein